MAATYPAHSHQQQNYVAAVAVESCARFAREYEFDHVEERDDYDTSLSLFI